MANLLKTGKKAGALTVRVLGHIRAAYARQTDGACMTCTGNQSPSILSMALTARAAAHAVSELKQGNLQLKSALYQGIKRKL
jgi:hypothetical protein